ncbi:hypothetical protein CC1G_08124 [Coprinopsis cinerea okayama7|uniref:DUF6533 domain-containing protein n=1 Tax=Coprinopsis cinerea (strain Okayama-7 / 130 / ATCC MYA-4618 / FGSC 9003) TaxID=240176 RepID=A8NZ03_COPC7|nr:hypothetical protein CC1G_08124 [Coprinopsis cinerea okayama7\|eukprot:XP_001837570.2 hypothetical protein CC1G_08124 [Coprinopsis cinerea okayama7\
MDLDLSVESVARTKFVSNLVETSCLVLWIADYLETLPLEISVMWTSSANKFSLVKSLFYSLRYLPFAFFALGLALEDELVDERVREFSTGYGRTPVEFAAFLELQATIDSILPPNGRHCRFGRSQPIPGLEAYSCGFIRSVQGNLLSIAWGIVAANEILMMSMTLLFVFKKHNNYRNRILEVFYRNGTLYIMAIVGNILTAVIAPRFVYLLTSWQATLHAVFSTRMVLQIREAANGTTSAVDQETAQTHIGALEDVLDGFSTRFPIVHFIRWHPHLYTSHAMDLESSIRADIARTELVAKLVETSCLSLWIVDYLETLPLEISIMWTSGTRKFSLVKCLFYTLRYVPLGFFALSFGLENNIIDEQSCRRRDGIRAVLTVAIVVLAEALLFVRVYAVGGRSKCLKYSLIGYFVVSLGIVFGLLIWHILSLTFTVPRPGREIYSCALIQSGRGNLVSIAWGIIAANEILMMAMTFFFVFMKHINRRNRILEVFYRNGTFYIIAIVGNILMAAISPNHLYLLSSYQATLHAIFSTRMVLQIREVVHDPLKVIHETSHVGPLEFAPLSLLSRSAGFSSEEDGCLMQQRRDVE